ncbi:MAG: S41 family peptidase [Clostridia bacterium]|nr:S41 family peptidase [Clostridia bacterium]
MNKKVIIAILSTMIITAIITASIIFMYFVPEDSTAVNEVDDQQQDQVADDTILNDAKIEEQNLDTEEDTIEVNKDDYAYLMMLYDKYKQVEALEEYIREYYYLDVSDIDFQSAIAKGLFEALDDPYSQYFTKEEYKAFTEVASGSYEGIGVVVAPGDDGFIVVVSPIADSPGFEAGLKTNDKVLKVDGVEYSADELDQAVLNIRGPKDTTVILTIRRDDEVMDIPVVRGEIRLEAAESEVLDNNIGLLRLVSFDEDAALEFENHLNSLLDQGVDGLILDLRNNGGGYLDQCLEITDHLLGEAVIVKTKDNAGNVEIEYSDADKIDIPLVILVNGGSASASEILTGAVKDNEAGTIVGTTTFGKGLVQTMIPLPLYDYAGFKLTIKQYFTPDDYYINKIGIEPNVFIEDDETTEADEQFDKAVEILLEQIQ